MSAIPVIEKKIVQLIQLMMIIDRNQNHALFSIFELLFSYIIMNLIVEQTNLYAHQIFSSHTLSPVSLKYIVKLFIYLK